MIRNPVLKGFCPDPSIIRAGDNYYIAVSTFEWWPGVKLFKSEDLSSWRQIRSPLRRESQLNMVGDPTSGGVWAPCLSYDQKRFYLVYTDVKTKKGRFYNTHNYLVTAEDIEGEWSEPVYLNSIGFDPSLFHDTDGRKYLINMVNGFKGILVQEVCIPDDLSGFRFVGEQKKVYDGSGIGCCEGPHMYHIGEWYYLVTAEGGTGYDHCVTIARSESVWGPFETMPGNPLLTSDRENRNSLQKCGHADMVQTQNGEWYMVHLCARPAKNTKWCILGRETSIQKIRWKEDGWPELKTGGKFAQLQTQEPEGLRKSPEESTDIAVDFGNTEYSDTCSLPAAFSSPRTDYSKFISTAERRGFLRMYGQESLNSLHHVSLLASAQKSFDAEAETEMQFSPVYSQQLAGLVYFYDAMNFCLIGKTATDEGEHVLVVLKSDQGVITDEMEPVKLMDNGSIFLRCIVSENGTVFRFSFRNSESEEWTYAGEHMSTELVSDEHCRGFTGAHFGMFVQDLTGRRIPADFRSFTISSVSEEGEGE